MIKRIASRRKGTTRKRSKILLKKKSGPKKDSSEKKEEHAKDKEEEEDDTSKTDEEWYEAERLLRTKVKGGIRYYEVEWKNKNFAPSWEAEDNISEYLKKMYHVDYTLLGQRRRDNRGRRH